jgi:hyperosmotically inducible protein
MRFLTRLVVLLVVVALGAYVLGFWSPRELLTSGWRRATSAPRPDGAGQTGEQPTALDEKAGRAVEKMDDFVSDASLSTKIKSMMALDDDVNQRTITVSTTSGVVTLEGTVRSKAEHDQAIRLARDTKGISRVVDHLVLR